MYKVIAYNVAYVRSDRSCWILPLRATGPVFLVFFLPHSFPLLIWVTYFKLNS